MDSSGTIHHSASDLSSFGGGRARLWHFSATHDHLAIEIHDSARQVAYLVLTGCSHFELPVVWILKHPEVRQETPTQVVFSDENVRIVCEGAIVQTVYSTNS
jgi:hypothetical protein